MKKILLLSVVLLLLSGLAVAQQEVSRWDAFGGFSYLSTPSLNLVQRGFNGEFGYNYNKWLALGVDTSYFTGHSSLGSDPLSLGVKAKLAPLMGMLPPGTTVMVPFDSSTFTFTMGPQINIRKVKPITFWVRPSAGYLKVTVTAKPNSALTTGVVQLLMGPSKTQVTDDVVFWGFGAGMDFNLSRHLALRTGMDFIHLNMFSNLLQDSRNTVRVSVGPVIRWGKSVD